MNSETLQLYINSIQHDFSHFAFRLEENGEKNTFYWKYRQRAFVEGIKKDIATKEYLESHSSFKIHFIASIDFFTNYLFKFYEKAFRYSLGGQPKSYLTSINITFGESQQRLKNLKYHKSSLLDIKLEDPMAAHKTAKLIQYYFQKILDNFMSNGVDLLKSPMGEDYNNIIKLFNGITSLKEIKIGNEITKISNQEMNKIFPEYLENQQPQQLNKDKPNEVSKTKKDTLWFKAGILFANGTMDKFWNEKKTGIKNEFTPAIIAKEVGLPKAEKYILATFNGYAKDNTNADKNIFNNLKKTDQIINHLKKSGIEIANSFLNKLQAKTN